MNKYLQLITFYILLITLPLLVASCARMGQPDGGWYDEKPPYVVGADPAEKDTCVTKKKLKISFNEFIKLDNASEKVMVSPPQHEQPEIKATGKSIYVELQDSLLPNTTYTVDFSDAISDNNEGNPLGNYTYTFSTGRMIDTLQVSGYVLEAEKLEPIKGILVGLYPVDSLQTDSLRPTPSSLHRDSLKAFTRVSRTDSRGKFVIRGVAMGMYHIGALSDQDNDYKFSQKSEEMAFTHDTIVPTCGPDTRQDTLWADQNHIKDIKVIGYTHFRPDNITLRAFTHKATDRHYLKAERTEANHFTLFFTAPTPDRKLPELRLLNPPKNSEKEYSILPSISTEGAEGGSSYFLVEPSAMTDTITYWLRDTALVNQDTLQIEMRTLLTDTLGVLRPNVDTLEILAKTPYAKRLKEQNKKIEEWKKDFEKKLKRAQPGEVIDSIMPKETLQVKYDCPQSMSPDGYVTIQFTTPLERFDTAAVHLYVEQDSLWYRAPLTIESIRNTNISDSLSLSGKASADLQNAVGVRGFTLFTDWIPGANYSFEVDSLAFTDIYGVANAKYKAGIQVAKLEDFGSLFVNVSGLPESPEPVDTLGFPVIVQLLDGSDNVVMTSPAKKGTAEFYYIKPGIYYLRCFIDRNGNGIWDTGDYYKDLQPEEVYYDPEKVECKAKWDLTRNWNITATPLYRQKPAAITKQKPEAEKTIKRRNAERAAREGIEIPEKYQ